MYTSVLIRNWRAFQRLGLREAFCPGSYHDSVGLNDPISMGEYRWPHGYIFGYDPTTEEVAWTSEWPVRERP